MQKNDIIHSRFNGVLPYLAKDAGEIVLTSAYIFYIQNFRAFLASLGCEMHIHDLKWLKSSLLVVFAIQNPDILDELDLP